ncbi:hypothetical protein CVV67_10650 [Arthrobacter stackebrandtii]|nr:hypothetical protein CVV67_10650 [Arthrobacter stackebrandtii]
MEPTLVAGPRLLDRWLLNIGAALGLICLVVAAAAFIFGVKPLIFASGSMAPAIPTGSLALAVPAPSSGIAPGEVVSVVSSTGSRVTHRVVSAEPGIGLVLKGDANSIADLQPFVGDSVDRVFVSFPFVGYLVSWLASPWLLLLGGGLCAYLLYVAFVRRCPGGGREFGDPPRGTGTGAGRRKWLGAVAVIITLAVAMPLGAAVKVESTRAAMAVTADAKSSITLGVMQPPTTLKCASSGTGDQNIDISWSAPVDSHPTPVAYRLTVGVSGKYTTADVTGTHQTMGLDKESGGLLGGVVRLLDSLVGGLLQLLLGGPQDVSVTVAAIYPGGWESPVLANDKIAAISKPLLAPMVVKCK